jgi:hypothetical protein
MEIRNRLFEKYEDFQFKIPLTGKEKISVSPGDTIKVGDTIFSRGESSLKKSIYIPKAINCKLEECKESVNRLDGEYIEQGEVIAMKVSSGRLAQTELISPVCGILDLSRLDSGYIDILGEERVSTFESNFKGSVISVDPSEGLVIQSNATCIDIVATTKLQEKYFGQLEILSDGKSIVKEDILDLDYRGKVVWVGPYLYKKVAIELFERGAVAVVTYAMSYSEFREIGLPIAVVGGFGSVHCDSLFLDQFINLKGNLVVLDSNENQLFVIGFSRPYNLDWFVDGYVNQRVISRSSSHYGYIGKVVELHDDFTYALVDFDKKGSVLIPLSLLEFIDL